VLEIRWEMRAVVVMNGGCGYDLGALDLPLGSSFDLLLFQAISQCTT
jgi:hypothetical protein